MQIPLPSPEAKHEECIWWVSRGATYWWIGDGNEADYSYYYADENRVVHSYDVFDIISYDPQDANYAIMWISGLKK